MEINKIRNFCIIAHIDHGKSTLADRFLEVTGAMEKRAMKHEQMLDTMDLEQERGITIKLQPVRMSWKGYQFNLIDTPGHVDFSYEVSRSLAAVEGAILVVDASQGIEAQTLTNLYMALEYNLAIIPVLNKIDLPAADPEKVTREIENTIGISKEEIISVSAKEGTNVQEVLDAIIERIKSPEEFENTETKALIFDSVFDSYRGVLIYIKLLKGTLQRGDKVFLLNAKKSFDIIEVGYFAPKYVSCEKLSQGEIGYVVTGLKTTKEARVGDTVWKNEQNQNPEIVNPTKLEGYKQVKPFVFATIFPLDTDDYPILRDSIDKLTMNDSSLTYEVETSGALGHGFRCGFLGLLHMEIVQERLEREYNMEIIITSPSVSFKITLNSTKDLDETNIDKDGYYIVSNPSRLPPREHITEIYEPYVRVEIITPTEFLGNIMDHVQRSRGIQKNIEYIDSDRVLVHYEIPLLEIIVDFYDKLKSISQGYASMNYEFIDYRPGDLVKVDIIVAGDQVDALSILTHRSNAENQGRIICQKLKEIIPKAQFVITIQASIGSKIIAREDISAMRKDVTAKLYGGDISRKMKLLKKQKEGKKRMKQMGRVSIPQEAFLSILRKE